MKNNKNIFTKIISDKRFITLIGLIIIVLISFPLAKNVSQRYQADKEIKELEEEIKKIGEKNSELSRLVDYFGSEEYLEEEARLNFGLKKPGETAVVISQKDSAVISGADQFGENSETDNNLKRWREYFFGE
jgi:cell division protein FtsB